MSLPDSYNARLQDRDVALLRGLFESRVMTLAQAAAIHFECNREVAKKRIQKLKLSGYLAERPRPRYAVSILSLTVKAFVALSDGGHLDEYPPLGLINLAKRASVSEMTLRHELDVMDFKATMFTAVGNRNDVEATEFSTWPLLYEFQARPAQSRPPMLVRPDAYVRLQQRDPDGSTSEHTFFVEVDRSTEVLDTLVTRALCYRDFYRRGGLAIVNGRPASEFADFPFRVLVVLRTEERRNNLTERLLMLSPPIVSQVWLSTSKEVKAEPFGAVWITPADYREAIRGTKYDLDHKGSTVIPYRRRSERETFIESTVERREILDT
jgi:hypothetical protein